jgi:hypothetical protein
MSAGQFGTVDSGATVTLEDVTCSGGWDDGLFVEDASTVTMRDCVIEANGSGVVTSALGTGVPTIDASDCDVLAQSPSWLLEGAFERLTGCQGQGLSVLGANTTVTGFVCYGICDVGYGVRLGGEQNHIDGGTIACVTEVGLLSEGAVCSRASNLKIIAEHTNDTNCSEWAVQVTGSNTTPEVMLDGIDICGPGETSVLTYGCNQEPNDCAEQPCTACDTMECDDSTIEVPHISTCDDEDCWPPVEDRLPQAFSYCYNPAGLWDVQVPIKTTRHIVLSLRDLTAGAMSNILRCPLGILDCLVSAELNVWVDDYDLATGDTEVTLFDDSSAASWTLLCPATDAFDEVLTNYSVGASTLALDETFRCEVVSVTVPDVAVQASVTLRFP